MRINKFSIVVLQVLFSFFVLVSCTRKLDTSLKKATHNYALVFDGKDDKIGAYLKPLKQQWTVSAWVKGDDLFWNDMEPIFSSSWSVIPEWEGEPLNIRNGFPAIGNDIISKKKLDDNWHHLVAVNNGVDFILYVDGVQEAKGNGGKGTCVYNIGTSNDKIFFDGTLDELRVWNVALSKETINDWMFRTLNTTHPNYDNLIVAYGFDDQALDATDLTGNVNGDIKYYYGSDKTTDTPIYAENSNSLFQGVYQSSDYKAPVPRKRNVFEGLKDQKGGNILKVLAWNIWHGGVESGVDLGRKRVVEIIKESTADVVLMVETYGSAKYIAEALGFNYYTLGDKDNLCVFSRFPIVDFYPSKYNGFYSLGAKVKMPNNKEVVVWDVWLMYALPDYTIEINRPGYTASDMVKGDNEYPLKNINEILKQDIDFYLKGDTPLILGGDFNACSHLDWTEETAMAGLHYGKVVDFPVSKIMFDHNFKDSFREVKPDPVKNIGATWSPIMNYCEDFRIDFIYYKGPGIKVLDSRVIDQHPDELQFFPSDHAGVLSVFEIN